VGDHLSLVVAPLLLLMPIIDFHKAFRLHLAFPPVEYTDTVHTSSALDTLGDDSICFVISCGQVSGTVDFYIEESSDDGVSDSWVKVTGSDMPQIATNNQAKRVRSLLNSRERYLRAKMTVAGGDAFASVIALSQPTYTGDSTPCETNI